MRTKFAALSTTPRFIRCFTRHFSERSHECVRRSGVPDVPRNLRVARTGCFGGSLRVGLRLRGLLRADANLFQRGRRKFGYRRGTGTCRLGGCNHRRPKSAAKRSEVGWSGWFGDFRLMLLSAFQTLSCQVFGFLLAWNTDRTTTRFSSSTKKTS